MKYYSARFYYVRFKIIGDIIAETYRSFQWKVWLWSVLFLFLFSLHLLVSLFFRVMDEIFHRRYKKQKVTQPVFIIANPRSGTTYLHRLMALDSDRFVYPKNAHTFFMTSSFVQFYNLFTWVDRKFLFGFIRTLIDRLDDVFWGGWDDIHAMGFNKAEEDELVFAQMMMSPGIFIPFPYFHLHDDNKFLDDESDEVRHNVMEFYESSIKRFVFRAGSHKTYLTKNVMSTARFKSILQRFPDAKIIYIARHPYHAVPSMASMFTAMYDKKIQKNSPPKKVWAQYAIDFFKYSREMRRSIPDEQFIAIKYDDLLEQPQQVVQNVYTHFGWQVSEKFLDRLSKEQVRNRDYKSGHEYSLEEYGFTKEQVWAELEDIMNDFAFAK